MFCSWRSRFPFQTPEFGIVIEVRLFVGRIRYSAQFCIAVWAMDALPSSPLTAVGDRELGSIQRLFRLIVLSDGVAVRY